VVLISPDEEAEEEEEESEAEGVEEAEEEAEETGRDEISSEALLWEVLDGIDEEIRNLDEEMKQLTKQTDAIREMVYKKLESKEVPPELEKPGEFRKLLDKLNSHMGKTIEYIVRVEKTRKKLEYVPWDELVAESMNPEALEGREVPLHPQQPPVNVTVSPPAQAQAPSVQRPGYWYYKAEKEKAKAMVLIQKMRMEQPTAVTTQHVTDIIQFGRQLQPALNKIKKWIPGALAYVQVFQNDHLFFLLHEECATFISQLLSSLESFVGACIEYRKNLLGGRKLGMARSIAKILESMAVAPQVFTRQPFSKEGFKLGKKGFQQR